MEDALSIVGICISAFAAFVTWKMYELEKKKKEMREM